MIITKEHEALTDLRSSAFGTAKVDLQDLVCKADSWENSWYDVLESSRNPLILTPQQTVQFKDGRTTREADITEFAFGQMCQKAGVPAAYVKKCFEHNKQDLAVTNYNAWAMDRNENHSDYQIRLFDGRIHAVVTDRYNVFDHSDVMHGIYDAVTNPMIAGKYEANQAFLSPDDLHIRFVDFNNPLIVGGDILHAGFTVTSNNVGSGALSIKYFLYRFVCRNGMVKIQNGGMLFRQTHLGDFADTGVRMFLDAIGKIDDLNNLTRLQIERAQNVRLTDMDLEVYLKKAQTELHIGKAGREGLLELVNNTYDRTLWGFLNAVTEQAQQYTLETRLNAEAWTGNMLSRVAA